MKLKLRIFIGLMVIAMMFECSKTNDIETLCYDILPLFDSLGNTPSPCLNTSFCNSSIDDNDIYYCSPDTLNLIYLDLQRAKPKNNYTIMDELAIPLNKLTYLAKINLYGLIPPEVSPTIPSLLGNMVQLTFLDLSNNGFSGTIPTSFNQLSKGDFTLKLADNPDLTGCYPKDLYDVYIERNSTVACKVNPSLFYCSCAPPCICFSGGFQCIDTDNGTLLSNITCVNSGWFSPCDDGFLVIEGKCVAISDTNITTPTTWNNTKGTEIRGNLDIYGGELIILDSLNITGNLRINDGNMTLNVTQMNIIGNLDVFGESTLTIVISDNNTIVVGGCLNITGYLDLKNTENYRPGQNITILEYSPECLKDGVNFTGVNVDGDHECEPKIATEATRLYVLFTTDCNNNNPDQMVIILSTSCSIGGVIVIVIIVALTALRNYIFPFRHNRGKYDKKMDHLAQDVAHEKRIAQQYQEQAVEKKIKKQAQAQAQAHALD